MIYIFTGRDSYRLDRAVSRLKEETGAGELTEANFTPVEAGNMRPGDLALIVSAMPFLAPKRLVVVSGLLERFESPARTGKGKTAASPVEPFAEVILGAPESTTMVITAASVSARNPLFKALSGSSRVRTYELLGPKELADWIIERVQAEGGKISPPLASVIARRVGPDLWAMSGEIDKLVLYAGKNQITARMLDEVLSYQPEANIFKMVDAVVEGKPTVCQAELERLVERGISPQQIMAMLARQLHLITLARIMLDRGSGPAEIQRSLGITHDFVARKTLQQARSYAICDLRNFYAGLLEVDLAIKTSRMQPVLALNLFFARMAGTTSPV